MRRIMIIVLALVAALGITASSASTATTETGVTPKSVKIGATFPLTGGASPYATISVAMQAYFSYVNARRGPDGKRGVNGRQIIFSSNFENHRSGKFDLFLIRADGAGLERLPPTRISTASRCGVPMDGNSSGPPTVMAQGERRISLWRSG